MDLFGGLSLSTALSMTNKSKYQRGTKGFSGPKKGAVTFDCGDWEDSVEEVASELR